MWTSILLKYTEIDFDELVKILSWSGSMLLDVFIEKGDNHPRSQHFVDLICKLPRLLQEMGRIRTFRVLLPTKIAGAVLGLFVHPAPALQKFYFEVDEDGEIQPEMEWVTLHEAFTLSYRKAPNLKHIHLPISSGFKGLRSFWRNLSKIHFQFISNMPIDGYILLDILQHSASCLYILSLTWSFVSPSIIFSRHHRRVSLPCLQELLLRGTCEIDYINFVLERLDFPIDKVNFDITCVDLYSKLHDSTSLMHFISQRRLSLLTISRSSTGMMAISFSEQTSDMNMESPAPDLYSSGNPVLRTLYDGLDDLSYLLRETRMSDTITHVCLEDYPLKTTLLRDILVLLPNVQYFRVYHGSRLYEDFDSLPNSHLRALIPPGNRVRHSESNLQTETTGSNSEINNVPNQVHLLHCPSLHTLQLVFRGGFLDLGKPYLRALLRCFEIREEKGHPLKSIIIWYEFLCMVVFFKEWLEVSGFKCLHNIVEFRSLPIASDYFSALSPMDYIDDVEE